MISKAEKELHEKWNEPKVKSSIEEIGYYIAGSLVFFACISMMIWPVQIAEFIGSWKF